MVVNSTWREGVAEEVEAAALREKERLAREEQQREATQERSDAASEQLEVAANRARERLANEEKRRDRVEDRFDEFLETFERAGGLRTTMEAIVADLNAQGLDAELEVQSFARGVGRVASCMAAIRVRFPKDEPSHASVVVVASGDHPINLLEIVQSRARQRETEISVALSELTEDRIGESVLAVVREVLKK